MISKKYIEDLAAEFLEDSDLFAVKITVSKDNNIRLFIDGDNGVTIDDCVGLSRHIEGNLDRDKEDFELNVSSSGVAAVEVYKSANAILPTGGLGATINMVTTKPIDGKNGGGRYLSR